MSNKKGFTLSEVMITLGVMGILAAIAIPAVMKTQPDNNKLMYKKAYSTMEKTISDMINDEGNYPPDVLFPIAWVPGNVPQGFYNTAEGTTDIPDGVQKFCYLFAQNVNTVGEPDCFVDASSDPNFITTDGITWKFQTGPFKYDGTPFMITIDINGTKGPNCLDETSKCAGMATPDIYEIGVRYDGKISVPASSEAAIRILTNPTNNQKQD